MDKRRIGLLLLIFIAFALRLTLLGKQSLWYDEGVTWMLSQMQLSALIQWTADDIQPPLYYLLIWTTDILLGDSEWALRFPSVIFGVLTLPLIYVLARRLFATEAHRTGVLAAALVAISPLMVYYSQEARMYTLLTFEAALASYLLLKTINNYQLPINKSPISNTQRALRLQSPLLYALTTAAALYTHYFAAFLLVAHAVYAIYIWWQRQFNRPLLRQLLLAFGGAVLLFSPWLPTLLARLGDDPSYWPGALKLNEAVRKIIISFTAGETVIEQTGWWLALVYLGFFLLAGIFEILGLGLSLSVVRRSSFVVRPPSALLSPLSSLFLLLWLLLPILLILTLTYWSPKFNPRYALLAWPAFALLTAALLSTLLEKQQFSRNTQHASRLTPHASLLLFSLFLLFILSTSTVSLTNWFTDRRFSKDDFRALAQFVRERKAPNETVLLSSGHLFPVWAYYAGWEGWTPLPWMLRLDVNQITDLSIAADIAEAVEGQAGVWLVTWQDEVIDPNGVVPFWLDLIGQRPNDAGDFWGVGLEHWQLNPDNLSLLHQNPIHRPVGYAPADFSPQEAPIIPPTGDHYNFANRVELLGYTQLSDTDLALFWRPRRPLPTNLILTLDITDKAGFDWDRQTIAGPPGSPLYPPSRWPANKIVMTRHRLNWQVGTPPGLYVVEVGLGQASQADTGPSAANAAPEFTGWDVLDAQGRPHRRTALLDYVNLSQLVEPQSGNLPIDDDPEIDFFPIIGVRRAILPQNSAQPGERVLLALLWQAGRYNADDVSIAFDLVDAAGQTHRVGSSVTPSRQFNLPRWEPGDVVLGQYWLDIPPEAAAGPAQLKIHIVNSTGFFYDELFPLAEFEVLPTERNFTPPPSVGMPLQADFSGRATLLGADCSATCTARPGESVALTLYWRAEAKLETGYTVFTHLLGQDETVLLNADHAPPKPTQGWVPGEIITDAVTLNLPADLPPGSYPIEIGLYNATDPAFTRLPLTNGKTRVILPKPLTVE